TIQAQVIALMKEMKVKFNTSVIMITHDLGIIAETCDNVAVMYAGEIVEKGSLEQIFTKCSHPYTRGLFDCIPDLSQNEKELIPIKGLMPDPTIVPKGCSFAERCPYADEKCTEVPPMDCEIEPGHTVCCHRPLKKENV
ncbi:MAG: ABC transporter ATP-binding protein, partial [Oscillospiraceae bacterium]|nr:ABC transporter ATP-binding protein [Oscillospiraceae bacterium]